MHSIARGSNPESNPVSDPESDNIGADNIGSNMVPDHNRVIFGVPEGHDARIMADMARKLAAEDKVLIHIAMDSGRLAGLRELLSFFAPDVRVCSLPAWDCLPYDRVSPHGDIVADRVSALTQLLTWKREKERYPRILLVALNATVQKVMPQKVLEEAGFSASVGGELDIANFQAFLTQNGYIRTETVREIGEFAVRGGIIDLFPAGYDDPLRIDLFGDEIESIRLFDPITQRTKKDVKSFTLQPAGEIFLNEDSISRFRSAYRDLFGVVQKQDPLYEAVSAGRRYNGMEHWLPLFYDNLETVFDYVPNAQITADPHIGEAYKERIEQIRDFYHSRKILLESAFAKGGGANKGAGKGASSISGAAYNPVPVSSLYLEDGAWNEYTKGFLQFSAFGAPENDDDQAGRQQGGGQVNYKDAGARKGRNFVDVRALADGDLFGELKKHISMLQSSGKKVVIACYGEGSKQRLCGLMEHAGIANIVTCFSWKDIKKLRGHSLGVAVLAL